MGVARGHAPKKRYPAFPGADRDIVHREELVAAGMGRTRRGKKSGRGAWTRAKRDAPRSQARSSRRQGFLAPTGGARSGVYPCARQRFEDQGGNANGDYYVVETDGRLGLYDDDGPWLLLQRDSP